jgi:hypothetical protein
MAAADYAFGAAGYWRAAHSTYGHMLLRLAAVEEHISALEYLSPKTTRRRQAAIRLSAESGPLDDRQPVTIDLHADRPIACSRVT